MASQIIRKDDRYFCAVPKHMGTGTVKSGSTNVLIEGKEAATTGSSCRCLGGQPAGFLNGNASILVNGKPICTSISITNHGGIPISGSSSVVVE